MYHMHQPSLRSCSFSHDRPNPTFSNWPIITVIKVTGFFSRQLYLPWHTCTDVNDTNLGHLYRKPHIPNMARQCQPWWHKSRQNNQTTFQKVADDQRDDRTLAAGMVTYLKNAIIARLVCWRTLYGHTRTATPAACLLEYPGHVWVISGTSFSGGAVKDTLRSNVRLM